MNWVTCYYLYLYVVTGVFLRFVCLGTPILVRPRMVPPPVVTVTILMYLQYIHWQFL
jgi:hypothetical protein